MRKAKIFLTLIITLVFELIIICLSVAVSALRQYKIKNITSEIMSQQYSDLLFHPINSITYLIKDKNPILILGTVAAIILAIYIVYFGTKKGDYKIESKYAVHGSSRFASNNEIFVKEETIGTPVKQMIIDLENSMRGSDNNESK